MKKCDRCGRHIEDGIRFCWPCLLAEHIVMQAPVEIEEVEIMAEPCEHEFKEINDGMAQCIFCGVIED